MIITLQWSWLKYDIDQETQKAAKCLITNDPSGELTSEAQTADDIFDLDYCKRKVTEACVRIQDILHKFPTAVSVYKLTTTTDPSTGESVSTETPITLTGSDTLLHEAVKWQFSIDNFASRSSVNDTLLATELHRFIVIFVLQEWTKLTHPTLEQNYLLRLTDEENKIKSIIYRRRNPSRPA